MTITAATATRNPANVRGSIVNRISSRPTGGVESELGMGQ